MLFTYYITRDKLPVYVGPHHPTAIVFCDQREAEICAADMTRATGALHQVAERQPCHCCGALGYGEWGCDRCRVGWCLYGGGGSRTTARWCCLTHRLRLDDDVEVDHA